MQWKRLKEYTAGEVEDWRNYANGCLIISVINPLVNSASESTTSGIYLQVFVSGGKGFQFAQPTLEAIDHNGVYLPQGPPATQIRQFETEMDEPLFVSNDWRNRKFKTEMDEDQNFSSEGIKNKNIEVIGTIGENYTTQHLHMSTNVTSLKQLFNMGGTCMNYNAPSAGDFSVSTSLGPWLTYRVNPTGDESNPAFALITKNFLTQLVPAFGFYRGSLRISFECPSVVNKIVNVQYLEAPEQTDGINNCIFGPVASGVAANVALWFSTEGTHSSRVNTTALNTYDVAWYSPYRYLPIRPLGLPTDSPRITMLYQTSIASGMVGAIMLSGGDDFMVSMDAPLPYIRMRKPSS
jgi:hypothetical protein